jgi:ferredoxin-nitrite reductase
VRLKYVLDAMGIEKFVALLEEKLGRKFDRAVPGAVAPRPVFDRSAHIGIHAQKQQGLNWIGVVLPVGRMSVAQMHGLAAIARDLGDGDLRLTVWQNLLISGLPTEKLAEAQERIEALGLAIQTNAIRSGLIACTGNTGCKFAASDTKRHAEDIAAWCETRLALDTPVNIHLTGCHHSCAQHFVSEIGLLACKVQANEDDDPVEGLSHSHRRRLRSERRARPRTLSRRCGRRRTTHHRAHSEGLSDASRFAGGIVPRLLATA